MDAQVIELFVNIGLPVFLIGLGWFAGASTERRHYQSIHEREKQFLKKPAITSKQWDPSLKIVEAKLASGSVVVSVDHFKRFLSVFRMLFGGEVHSFSSLIDRGRREALLRMKESEPDADAYLNTRLETSTISNNTGRSAVGTIEVFAYGTAVKFE